MSFIPAIVRADWVYLGNNQWAYKDNYGKYCFHTWIHSGTKVYYVNKSGLMASSYNYPFGVIIDGSRYFFNKKGELQKNTWYKGSDGETTFWYYLNSKGNPCTGWKKIGSKWYYFDLDYGFMFNQELSGLMIEGKRYFFDKSGAMLSNCWAKVESSSGGYSWFYLNKNGNPCTGWKKIGGKWYYLDPDLEGRMVSNAWREDPEGSGDWYHFDKNGVMETSKWIKVIDEEDGSVIWYYQLSNGIGAVGWQKISKKWYYFDPDTAGRCVMDSSKEIGGKVYIFDKNGVCTNP
jgi:glucan-binding YG repeat protein